MRLTELERIEYEKYTAIYDFTQFLQDKTVLITGFKGIVGGGISKWLLFENKRKGNNTHIIASSRTPEIVPNYIDKTDNISFCKFGEEGSISKHIDYIVHGASPTSNTVFMKEPVESLRSIIDGTERILDLAKMQKDCSVIYLSSEEAYGAPTASEPVAENFVGSVDSLNIRSCYSLGKKTSELLCRSYFEEYGLKTKILRPTVIMGLFQPYDSVKVECEILRCIMENKNLHMKSNGMTKKCVIYSMDALSAVLTVLFKGKSGEAYNATNPETYETVKDRAYNAFAKHNPNSTIEFEKLDTSIISGYLPQRALQEDISKISALGWKPLASMDYIYEIDMKRFSDR